MGDGEFKQPYLYGEGKTALETPMQAEVYSSAPEMESQWKQPWRSDSYPKMEAELAWPGMPSYKLPPGTYGPGGDCTPVGDAIGGGSVDPCQPGLNCGQWVWNCAHKIKSFLVVQNFGFIQNITYGANDTVTVTVCWNEGDRAAGRKVGPKAVLANGKDVVSTADMSACCPDKAVCTKACGKCAVLAITGYSSQQMSCSGTQSLTATGGGGKYKWSFTGGGSLSKSSGASVVYTAPATNAECANNPTVTLTDCCGTTTSLQFAVNCGVGSAYWAKFDCKVCYFSNGETFCEYACSGNPPGNGCWACSSTKYGCDGSFVLAQSEASGSGCDVPNCLNYCNTNCPNPYTQDIRTPEQKTAGCCPVALL